MTLTPLSFVELCDEGPGPNSRHEARMKMHQAWPGMRYNRKTMESYLTSAGYAALIIFGFLEAACIPISSEITFGFAGVLAYQGHLNLALVIIIGSLAELGGSYASYWVGRIGGRPLVDKIGRYVLVTQSDIDRAERFLAGRGAWAIPVGRALPVVRTLVSIVSGFVEVPEMTFALLSLVGTAIWVSAITLIGYAVGTQWKSIEKGISLAGYAIAALAVIGIAAFIWHRLREFRREKAAGHEGPREHQPK